jgi:hypothetical protein
VDLDLARLVPIAGDSGLVCRNGGAVLWVAARTPTDVVAELVERFLETEPASRIEQVGAVVATNDHSQVPPFAVVAKIEEDCAVFVFGAVQVRVEGPEVAETVVAGVLRRLTTEFTTVIASPAGGPGRMTIDPVVDVRAGIVAGDGFALTTFAEPVPVDGGGDGASAEPVPGDAASAEPEPEIEPETFISPSVSEGDSRDEPQPESWPEAVAVASADPAPDPERVDPMVSGPGGETVAFPPAAPPVEEPEEVAPETVQGVLCGQGHLNDPRTRSCPLCGAPVVPGSPIVAGPRPSLGRLLFDDGTECTLVADRVIGRQPETSPLVQNGSARPLRLEDPERSISRAHAEIRLVGWDVHFRNLSTTNGSFLWDPTSSRWVPLDVDQPLVLQPGMHIALGRRPALFESATRR